jgi:hypothetical protein
MIEKDESLLNQIVRQGKNLPGTRSFWKPHAMKLQSIATQLQIYNLSRRLLLHLALQIINGMTSIRSFRV